VSITSPSISIWSSFAIRRQSSVKKRAHFA
jgi:hypothetical protein